MDSSSCGQQSTSTVESSQSSVRTKTDLAWAHFKENIIDGKKSWTCLHCNNTYRGGGINRMKKHLAGRKGEIAACKKVSYDIRYQMEESLKENDGKKYVSKSVAADNLHDDFVIDIEEEERAQDTQPQKRRREQNMPSYFAPRTTPGAQPSIKSAFVSQEALHNADMAVARLFYHTCIPLNVVNSHYFKKMVDVIASIGPGYKLPNYNQLRRNLLASMKKEVHLLINTYRRYWEERGCTIMADGWQDRSNRQLINFLVYCKRGTTFVRSIDASDVVKDAKTICNLFVELVEWVG